MLLTNERSHVILKTTIRIINQEEKLFFFFLAVLFLLVFFGGGRELHSYCMLIDSAV
jgi:hypothetical protein